MGFYEEPEVKSGTRANYVESIITQLREADGEILLWQQELAAEANMPLAAPYLPIMTALEYLGLVDRFTADSDEKFDGRGLGKANTAFAWAGDKVKIRDISQEKTRKPGQTKAEFEEQEEEDTSRSHRRNANGKSARRKAVEEPEDEYEDDDEYEDEEDDEEEEEVEVTPRRKRGSRAAKESAPTRRSRRSAPVVEDDDEEDDEPEEVAPRRSRRNRASSKADTGNDRPTRVRVKAEPEPAEEEEEDESSSAPPRRRPRRRSAA